MNIKDVLNNIDNLDEHFATLILNFVDKYIELSLDKKVVTDNLLQQIYYNVKGIGFQKLEGISGCVGKTGSVITLSSELEDWVLDNTFLHEFVHQISKNEYSNGENLVQPNCGLKVGIDSQMEFSAGFRLREWEVDGNNYAYNKGIETFDEWVTEWLANKMSGLINTEIKIDSYGFFRKKTSHGYDGSNIMNLLELVYGAENIANLLTGMNIVGENRKQVLPMLGFHHLNDVVDSNQVLNQKELEFFANLQPPYMKTPNITGLLVYYISEYQKQDKLENYNIWLQQMMDVLIRAYSVRFEKEIDSCISEKQILSFYRELTTIQNSMIWNLDDNILNNLESFNLYNNMRNRFMKKAEQLGYQNSEYSTLYFTPNELLNKFKCEEKECKELHDLNSLAQSK